MNSEEEMTQRSEVFAEASHHLWGNEGVHVLR